MAITPMHVAAGAQAVSTVGSLASSLGFGSKEKRVRYGDIIKGLHGSKYVPEWGRNMTYSEALGLHEGNVMKLRQQAGKELGLHPLVVAGMNPVGGPSMPIDTGSNGPDIGQGISDMGQGISRAASMYKTKEQQAMEKILEGQALERGSLENERLQAEIALLRGQAGKLASGPFMSGQGDSTDPRYLTQLMQRLGFGDQAPLFKEAKDPNGDTIRIYNEDGLGDNDVLSALISGTVSLGDIAANAGKQLGQWLTEPRYKKWW